MESESFSGNPIRSTGEFEPILFCGWTLFGHRIGRASRALQNNLRGQYEMLEQELMEIAHEKTLQRTR